MRSTLKSNLQYKQTVQTIPPAFCTGMSEAASVDQLAKNQQILQQQLLASGTDYPQPIHSTLCPSIKIITNISKQFYPNETTVNINDNLTTTMYHEYFQQLLKNM